MRSFNEVFSPIIETGSGRIHKPHNVDDLTDFYKTDEYGNIVPNFPLVSQTHKYVAKPEDTEEMLSPRNGDDMVSDVHIGCRTSTTEGTPEQSTDSDAVTPIHNQEPRKRKKYRRGYYVPGRRPMVDFLIKIMETFQLTASSKFITSRPRYENSQLQFVPNTYHDIY